MKAIITKTYGGHRIRATDNDGNTVHADRDSARQYEEQHDDAARALCAKMDWHGTLIKGYLLRRGGIVHERIYVWHKADHTTVLTV